MTPLRKSNSINNKLEHRLNAQIFVIRRHPLYNTKFCAVVLSTWWWIIFVPVKNKIITLVDWILIRIESTVFFCKTTKSWRVKGILKTKKKGSNFMVFLIYYGFTFIVKCPFDWKRETGNKINIYHIHSYGINWFIIRWCYDWFTIISVITSGNILRYVSQITEFNPKRILFDFPSLTLEYTLVYTCNLYIFLFELHSLLHALTS